jgi:hypothetical protein
MMGLQHGHHGKSTQSRVALPVGSGAGSADTARGKKILSSVQSLDNEYKIRYNDSAISIVHTHAKVTESC